MREPIDVLLAQITFPGFAAVCFAWTVFGVAIFIKHRTPLVFMFTLLMLSLAITWHFVAVGSGRWEIYVWYRPTIRLLWAWDFLLTLIYTIVYLWINWRQTRAISD